MQRVFTRRGTYWSRMLHVAGPVYSEILNVRYQVFKYLLLVYLASTIGLPLFMFAFPPIARTSGFLVVLLSWIVVICVALASVATWWGMVGRLMVADLRRLGVDASGFPPVHGAAYLSLWLKKHSITREQLRRAEAARARRTA